MTIIKNSAKCTACGIEVESKHRHDFNTHWCEVEPTPGKEWIGGQLVPSGRVTFRFAVDGGKSYLKRCGTGFVETSETIDETV